MRQGSNRRRLSLALVLTALTVGGCVAASSRAPAVEGPLAAFAQDQDADVAQLARGREVLVANCARCHSLYSPADHTVAEWQAVLPRMSDNAGLKPREAEDLRVYILTARAFLTQPPSTDPAGSGE